MQNQTDNQALTRNYANIEQWLVDAFARLGELPDDTIDVDRAFVDYQLDSSVAVSLAEQFGHCLGLELQATIFWEYPNIRELANAFASHEPA